MWNNIRNKPDCQVLSGFFNAKLQRADSHKNFFHSRQAMRPRPCASPARTVGTESLHPEWSAGNTGPVTPSSSL